MAVTKTPKPSAIIIAVETGVGADGGAVYANRTIGKINPALTDEDAYDIGAAIGTLQSCPVGDIARRDMAILSRA